MEHKVKEYYNRVAATYDRRWHWYVHSTLARFTRHLPLTGKESILDVACGTGELQKLLLGEHPSLQLVGVDLCESMVEIAQGKLAGHNQVSFHHARASQLPFPDHSFDIAVSANSFHYFNDPVGSLVEMRRVVKPGGNIVIMDWCRNFLACKIFDVLLKLYDPAHSRCFTTDELRAFYEASGLRVKSVETFRLGYFWGLMLCAGEAPTG